MVDGLFDTNILIDVLRNYQPAINWLNTQVGQMKFAISPMVYMEMMAGSKNKVDQQNALKLMDQFELLFYSRADVRWAMEQMRVFRLSHNVDIADCFIASQSVRLQVPLYTKNLKHMMPILGALAIQSY
jgi:predicted nucleic acid-binding protein